MNMNHDNNKNKDIHRHIAFIYRWGHDEYAHMHRHVHESGLTKQQ